MDPDAAVARHLAVYESGDQLARRARACADRAPAAAPPRRVPDEHRGRGRAVQPARGLYRPFDRVFLSTELGLHKPDRAIFDRVLAELGCAPAEARLHRRQARERGRRASGRMHAIHYRDFDGFSRELARSHRAGFLRGGRQVRRGRGPPPRGPPPADRRGRFVDDLRRGGLSPRGDPPEPARSRADPRDQDRPRARRTPRSSRASPTPTPAAAPAAPDRRRPAAAAPGSRRVPAEDRGPARRWPTSKVRYVGEPVAVVVATDPYAAEDALELIDVDYEPLAAGRRRGGRGSRRGAAPPRGVGRQRGRRLRGSDRRPGPRARRRRRCA